MSENLNLPNFKFGNKLGSGSYANVYSAEGTSGTFKGKKVAIKCIKKNELSGSSIENILTEIKLLKSLNHHNVVKMYDFAWNESYIFVIMEYCEGGDLLSVIRKKQKLPQSICQKFLQQLGIALKYLRDNNVSHLDLKPQNILLSSRRKPILKLADFGLSQHLSEGETESTIRGSPLYMAPEILLRKEYSAKVDLWSVGVILYECLFGKAPFVSPTIDKLVEKIKSDEPIQIPANILSDDCRDLLQRLLERNPEQRISFEEFFTHPYVDLEHAPTIDSYPKAVCILNDAVEQDTKGNKDAAMTLYNEGLQYLAAAMEYEENSTRRVAMREKYLVYLKHLHTLRNTQKSSSDCLTSHAQLIELCKKSPALCAAVEIASAGDLYMLERSYSIALEKYTSSLGKLIELIHLEPPGTRKALLLKAVEDWMLKAEEAKSYTDDCQSEMNKNDSVIENSSTNDCDADRCLMQ